MADLKNLFDDIGKQSAALERLRRFDGGDGGGYDGDMDIRLTALETKLDTILPTLSTKADMGELRADMGEMRADLHKTDASIKTWMLATMLSIIGAMLAAIFGINQIYKSSATVAAPQQAQAPIIINVPQPAAAPQTPSK